MHLSIDVKYYQDSRSDLRFLPGDPFTVRQLAMTIKLTSDEFYEQFQEAKEEELQWDVSDKLDVVKKFDTRIAQGWWRTIWLREGIRVEINQAQHRDRVIVNFPETKHRIACIFTLSGELQTGVLSLHGEKLYPEVVGKYRLIGSGLRPKCFCDCSDAKPYSEIQVYIDPEVFYSFTTSSDSELPKNLQHLIKSSSQETYMRSGNTQPMMNSVLQQILHCPYQGMVKRAYLESKAIELMALVLDHEIAIERGEAKTVSLKPEQLERIHYAKEILLRDLSNPPCLEELARQAGLNDFILKKGFREVFDTTVFGVLQAHRLELAKQLLAECSISTTEISRMVGYASPNSFARAFKHKFGFTPTKYRKACG